MTTLVIGVVLEAANSSEPDEPLGDRATVPSVVAPFMNATEMGNAPKEFGSNSKPNLVVGVESVSVKDASVERAANTFGVAVSAFGGLFQVDQPLTPT